MIVGPRGVWSSPGFAPCSFVLVGGSAAAVKAERRSCVHGAPGALCREWPTTTTSSTPRPFASLGLNCRSRGVGVSTSIARVEWDREAATVTVSAGSML